MCSCKHVIETRLTRGVIRRRLPAIELEGFEADDVLGTITEKLKKEKNLAIIIASGDMDTMQLVDKQKVQVFTLKKGITDTILYDEEKVMERFGFEPKFLPDYKGLRGDPSDNIIGIKGIGEKTATDLIRGFGTIENIYKKIKKDEAAFSAIGLKPRMLELLRENEEEALFSKTLSHSPASSRGARPTHSGGRSEKTAPGRGGALAHQFRYRGPGLGRHFALCSHPRIRGRLFLYI